jgi:O-antigen/teichoic acid export membrane protein
MSMNRGIFYTFLTQAPTLLLFFVSSTLMTRMLGDEGRGAYALLTNQVAFIAMLLSLNISFGITYFTSKSGAERAVIGTGMTMLLVNLLITPILLYLIGAWSELNAVLMPRNASHWLYSGFVLVNILLALVNGSISAVLLGLKKFKPLNWMSITNAGLNAFGFVALYVFQGSLPEDKILPAVLIVSTLIQLIATGLWCMLYALYVGVPPIPVWTWSVLRPILAFSLVGHLSNLINLINYRFDVWVVDQYHGTAALGLYAVGVGVGQLLFYVPEPFSRVVQPYLYGQVKDEMLPRFKAVSRLNFSLVLVLSVALGVLSPWLIPLLFGNVFSGSVVALWFLLPGIVFSSAFKLIAQLVVHGGGQRFNLLATSIGAVLTILLDLLLIPSLGIVGAAIASSISYLSILLTVLAVVRYRLGIDVHDMFLVTPKDIAQLMRSAPWKAAR